MSESTEATEFVDPTAPITNTYAAFNQRVLVNPTALRTTLATASAEADKKEAKSKTKPDTTA